MTSASLSSFLLQGRAKDSGLDALFAKAPAATSQLPGKKRAAAADFLDAPAEEQPAEPAVPLATSGDDVRASKRARKAAKKSAVERDLLRQGAEEAGVTLPKSKKRKVISEDDSLAVYGFEKSAATNDAEEPIIHESLLPGYAKSKASRGTKRKREEADAEAPTVRAARTVFVGNVPLECVTSKRLKKALLAHLLFGLPDEVKLSAKAESIRFRSLPLADPVNERSPKKGPESVASGSAETSHATKRAAAFKTRGDLLNSTAHEEDDAASRVREHEHRFLTAAQKRKVAAITGEINSNAESCVAFVVLDGQDTAKAVIATANGSDFQGRTLRVDAVRGPSADDKAVDVSPAEKKRQAEEERRTCFVGGLDFAESEEKLREWVEATLTRERGEPEETTWVERVRIVRDSSTGLGKGFAYVVLKDNDCVDELLALPPEHVKLSKRKLRFQRCKSAAKIEADAQRTAKVAAAKDSRTTQAKLLKTKGAQTIKRDRKAVREIAAKLEGLTKEERKAAKASDADRLARRAAKKQTRVLEDRKKRKAAIRAGKSARP